MRYSIIQCSIHPVEQPEHVGEDPPRDVGEHEVVPVTGEIPMELLEQLTLTGIILNPRPEEVGELGELLIDPIEPRVEAVSLVDQFLTDVWSRKGFRAHVMLPPCL